MRIGRPTTSAHHAAASRVNDRDDGSEGMRDSVLMLLTSRRRGGPNTRETLKWSRAVAVLILPLLGMGPAMTVKEMPQRVWRGRRKAMRLQRDLWLAQLALWPTLILSAVLLSAVTWAVWQRKSRRRRPDEGAPRPQVGLSG